MTGNPFPGLRPFRTDECHLFFGREEQTSALLSLLKEHRFLAVVGTSGSGKSSLVRAGLVPALHRGSLVSAGSHWEVAVLRPGGDPFGSLTEALVSADLYDAEDPETRPRLRATLSHSDAGLVEAIRQSDAIDSRTKVLIVVDQFEELFRFRLSSDATKNAASAFVDLLLCASESSENVHVAITMRSDFLGESSQIPGLAEAVNRGEYLIPRLSRDQRRDAIEKPVNVGGARIAPGLVEEMLNSVGDDPDQLPVLQHALMRTWDVWESDHTEGEELGVRHFEATGGMDEALSRHADEVYESLPDEAHRRVCERIFRALTEKGADNRGVRRPTRVSRLRSIVGAEGDAVLRVLESFRQPGVTFLMPGHDRPLEDSTVVDLSHESLMRVWRRLRDWVEDEAQSARVFARLSETATLWKSGKAGLYRDPDLQIATTWRESARPNTAWAEQYGGELGVAEEFLDRSREEAEAAVRREEEARARELLHAKTLADEQARHAQEQRSAAGRMKRLSVVAIAVAVVAIVSLAFAWEARRRADENALVASQKGSEAEELARDASRQAELARAETARADSEKERAESERDRWRRENYRSVIQLAALMLESEKARTRARVPEILWGTQRELRGWEWGHLMARCELEAWSISTGHPELIAVAASPDGSLIATSGSDDRVVVWETATLRERHRLDFVEAGSLEFDPSGRWLAIGVGEGGSTEDPTALAVVDVATGAIVHRSASAGGVRVAFHPDGSLLYVLRSVALFRAPQLVALSTEDWSERARLTPTIDFDDLFVDSLGRQVGLCRRRPQRGNRFALYAAYDLRPVGEVLFEDNNTTVLGEIHYSSSEARFIYGLASTLLRQDGSSESGRALLHVSAEPFCGVQHDERTGTTFAGSLDGSLEILPATGVGRRIEHGAAIVGIALLPRGRLVTAGADGLLKCWDPSRPPLPHNQPQEPSTASASRVEFAPNGRQFLFQSWERRLLFLYDVEDLSVRVLDVSATALGIVGQDTTFPTFRPGTGELVVNHADEVRFLDVGDPAREPTQTFALKVARAVFVSFSSSGERAAFGKLDGTIEVVDLETGRRFPGPAASAPAIVVLSPDGTRAARLSYSSFIVWEVETGRVLVDRTLPGKGEARPVHGDVRFHPDGKHVVFGNDRSAAIEILSLESGATVGTFTHPGGVVSLLFTEGGDRLVSSGPDSNVRVWEWSLRKELLSISDTGSMTFVDRSPDGRTLVYAGWQPSLRVARSLPWKLPRSAEFYAAADELLELGSRKAGGAVASFNLEVTNRSGADLRVSIAPPGDDDERRIPGWVRWVLSPGELRSWFGLSLPAGVALVFRGAESDEELGRIRLDRDDDFRLENAQVRAALTLTGGTVLDTERRRSIRADVRRNRGRFDEAAALYASVIEEGLESTANERSSMRSRDDLSVAFDALLSLPDLDDELATRTLRSAIASHIAWIEGLAGDGPADDRESRRLRLDRRLVGYQIELSRRRSAAGSPAEADAALAAALEYWNAREAAEPDVASVREGLIRVAREILSRDASRSPIDRVAELEDRLARVSSVIGLEESDYLRAVVVGEALGLVAALEEGGHTAARADALELVTTLFRHSFRAVARSVEDRSAGSRELGRWLTLLQELEGFCEARGAETESASCTRAARLLLASLVRGGDSSRWSVVERSVASEVLVPAGSVWRYHDEGRDLGVAWRLPEFDSSGWREGEARLGFGGDGEVTTLPSGSRELKPLTTYFLHRFRNDRRPEQLWIRLLRDDGAVVYLNGVEVLRDNLPTGRPIVFEDGALGGIAGIDERVFQPVTYISADALRVGENVLAVEVHQSGTNSSDLGFDLELAAAVSEDVDSFSPDEAARSLESYLGGEASSSRLAGVLWRVLGELELGAGRREEARRHLERARELSPASEHEQLDSLLERTKRGE